MSMNFERDSSSESITEQEGVLFAQPIWERRGKKRGVFGRKTASASPAPTIAPEPRTFAAERDYDEPMALDTPVERPMTRDYVRAEGAGFAATSAAVATTATPVDDDAGFVAPIGRPGARTTRGPRSKGMGPAAIVAGVITLGAVGAVGWYASRGNDGIPELAPGQPAGEQVAVAPLPPVIPEVPVRADTAPPSAAAPPRATVRASAPVRTARARPAVAAPSAGDIGVNASTTTALPAGPQPYSTLNPGATPAPVTPPVPTEAAPAPAEIPATPPVESTTPTEPAPETTVTPPTS